MNHATMENSSYQTFPLFCHFQCYSLKYKTELVDLIISYDIIYVLVSKDPLFLYFLTPRYSWNIANTGVKHQSINHIFVFQNILPRYTVQYCSTKINKWNVRPYDKKHFEYNFCIHTRKTANQNTVWNKYRVPIGRFWSTSTQTYSNVLWP
jgi:hypothetical protein